MKYTHFKNNLHIVSIIPTSYRISQLSFLHFHHFPLPYFSLSYINTLLHFYFFLFLN